MLIKIAEMTFLTAFPLNLPMLYVLNGVIWKGVSNLFESSSYSTYPEFDLAGGCFLYIKHTKTKGNEKMLEIRGVRRNR